MNKILLLILSALIFSGCCHCPPQAILIDSPEMQQERILRQRELQLQERQAQSQERELQLQERQREK